MKHGFTLIEIVVTIALMAIIMIPLALTSIELAAALTSADAFTSAVSIANREMALINITPFDNLATTSFAEPYTGCAFDVKRDVTTLAMMKRITVTVARHGSTDALMQLHTWRRKNVEFGSGSSGTPYLDNGYNPQENRFRPTDVPPAWPQPNPTLPPPVVTRTRVEYAIYNTGEDYTPDLFQPLIGVRPVGNITLQGVDFTPNFTGGRCTAISIVSSMGLPGNTGIIASLYSGTPGFSLNTGARLTIRNFFMNRKTTYYIRYDLTGCPNQYTLKINHYFIDGSKTRNPYTLTKN